MHDYPTTDSNVSATLRLLVLTAGRSFTLDSARVRALSAGANLPDSLRTHRPDVLLLTAQSVTPELADLLREERFHHVAVLLEAGADDAEAAGQLLDTQLTILDAPASAEALADAIAAAVGTLTAGDATGSFTPGDRLAALKRDADRVAAALGELAAGEPDGAARNVDAARIRAHIKARRLRDRFFDPELFADPAWDMLLDLSAARLEGRQVSVSSLCIAAAVPTTTALRWIKALVDRGLFRRESDPADARRAFIAMAPATATGMQACLEAVLNLPGQ